MSEHFADRRPTPIYTFTLKRPLMATTT